MKKILLTPYPPPYAGPETVCKNILKSNTISNRDDVIHINSTINYANAYKGEFSLHSVIRYFQILFNLVRVVKGDPRVFMYVSSSRLGFIKDSIVILILYFLKKRSFAQYHGSNFKNFYNSQIYIYKLYIKYVLSKLYCLVLLDSTLVSDFEDIHKDKKEILTNGLCLNDWPLKNKIESKEYFTIFYMAHITYSKGFYDLLHVYKQLFSEHRRRIRFLIAGEIIPLKNTVLEFIPDDFKKDYFDNGKGEYLKTIRFINSCHKYNASYYGVINDINKKIRLFEDADIFVLPSYSEGLSMACLEAMACGLPLVLTPVGAMKNIIQHGKNGLITPIGNRNELKKNIEILMNDEELRYELSKNNIKLIKNNYNIENIAERMLNIMNS